MVAYFQRARSLNIGFATHWIILRVPSFDINRDHFNKIRNGGPFWESIADLCGKLPDGTEVYRGRLASVVVGGGKRRLFVIGNYVKQCLLKPYHDWAMNVLRRIPNDGTYNQLAPLKYVRGGTDVSSFDLSSATDRFPSVMLFQTMSALFGEEVASATVVAGLSSSRLFFSSVDERPLLTGKVCSWSTLRLLPVMEPLFSHSPQSGVVGGVAGLPAS